MRVIYHPEVEEELRKLPRKESARILRVVDLFTDYKFSLTQNFLKKIVEDIWELRAGRYRLFFGIVSPNMVIVSIFRKATQKSPKSEIKLAQRRLNEYDKQK